MHVPQLLNPLGFGEDVEVMIARLPGAPGLDFETWESDALNSPRNDLSFSECPFAKVG
jgi:hypothetical protein